jgi:PAS domain S-box-containing protein
MFGEIGAMALAGADRCVKQSCCSVRRPAQQPPPPTEEKLDLQLSFGGPLKGPDKNLQRLESNLDDITQLACALCQSPVALVCSRDQQGWRLSHNFGDAHEPLNFDLAFYTFAVTQRRDFEISDLRSDPAFATSPLVSGAPHFRFFAGAPVTSDDGQLLGAICILDTRTRNLTTAQRQGMAALARQVRAHLTHQQAAAAQERAQADAQEQQRQWRRMFESSSIGMAQVDAEGRWMNVNGAFCAMLGYTGEEILETNPDDLIHPDDLHASIALIRKTLAGEIPSCCGEKRLLHKTGECIWCSLHITLVRGSDSQPAYFLGHIVDITELRQAQDGWRNADLQNKALLDLPVPVGILTTNGEGEIAFANRHVELLTGYAGEELWKRMITSLFLDKELREHSQSLARLVGAITHGPQVILEHARSIGPETREWTWLRKDGTTVRISLTVTAVRSPNNTVTGFAMAATQATIADASAAGTVEGRFRTIADSAPLGMFLTDAHGGCTYINEAFRQITGIGGPESMGDGWLNAFASGERAAFYTELQKAMRRGSDFTMEIRLAREGHPAWARVRGREIFFDDVAQGYVGTLEEVTTARVLLQKLKAGEEMLRSVLTAAPVALALIDRERKCTLASVGWLELHHRSWHDVNGRNILDFMPEVRERLEDLCRRALNGGSQLIHEQTIHIQGEGPAEWIRWNVFPWRSSGEVVGIAIYEERLTHQMRLLNDAKAAQESAEAASRIKSEFLAEVATELKTPGAGIIGLTDMLLETETIPQRREYLEMIKTSTGSWLKLASDLNEFSKIESRKLELEILPFNLIDGLNQTMRRLAISAENKGVELICQTAPEVPSVVVGDGTRLFQTLSHLVNFAIEMTTKGDVVVSVEPGESADRNPSLPSAVQFHFVVRDNSGWLTDNKLADIQQVLLMVETSPGLKKIGTGLGIVLAARLANLLSGKLWVEREDHGAAIHLTVPLSGKPQPPAKSKLLSDLPVLIADHNQANARWLQQLLTTWGMKPTMLEKPSALPDVLEIANEAKRPFRFVLLDAHIPDRDAFAFATQIKKDRKKKEVTPILFLSAAMRVADESRARELGLEHTLVKPINVNELRELMERIIGGPVEIQPPITHEVIKRAVIPRPRLSVLLVDNSRFNQEVAMGVFGQKGHRLTVAQNGKEAVAILSRRACDMVLLRLDIPGENSLETLAAIRQREKEGQKTVRVFGLTSDRKIANVDSTLGEITDGFLASPIQPRDLTLLLEQIEPELETGY